MVVTQATAIAALPEVHIQWIGDIVGRKWTLCGGAVIFTIGGLILVQRR